MTEEGWGWIGTDAWVNDAASYPDNVGDGVVGVTPIVNKQSAAWASLTGCYANHKDDCTGHFGNFSLTKHRRIWTSYLYDNTLYGPCAA